MAPTSPDEAKRVLLTTPRDLPQREVKV